MARRAERDRAVARRLWPAGGRDDGGSDRPAVRRRERGSPGVGDGVPFFAHGRRDGVEHLRAARNVRVVRRGAGRHRDRRHARGVVRGHRLGVQPERLVRDSERADQQPDRGGAERLQERAVHAAGRRDDECRRQRRGRVGHLAVLGHHRPGRAGRVAQRPRTARNMVSVIQGYCNYLLVDLADTLIDLKELGADRFDQGALWKNVRAGVVAVQVFTQAAFNAPTVGPLDAVKTQIVPLLSLPGVSLQGDFEGAGAGDAVRFADGVTLTQCERSIFLADGPDAANGGYFAPSSGSGGFGSVGLGGDGPPGSPYVTYGTCYRLPASAGGLSSGLSIDSAGANTVILMDRALPSEGPLSKPNVVTPTTVSDALRRQATAIAVKVNEVCMRYNNAIDLVSMRGTIDAGLATYYGAVYTDEVSNEVTAVLSLVASLKASGGSQPQMYLDGDALAAKVAGLSDGDSNAFQLALVSLQDAANAYRTLYPTYEPTGPAIVANAIVVYVGGALLIAYLVFAAITWSVHVEPQQGPGSLSARLAQRLPLFDAVIRMVLGLCVLTALLFILEAVQVKSLLRTQHDLQVREDNGSMLVGAAVRANEQFYLLRTQVRPSTGGPKSNSAEVQAAAAAFLADAKSVVDLYARCNTITAAQSSMPRPIAETAVYVTVGLAFFAVAAYVVTASAPVQCFKRIRTLRSGTGAR
ncbi:hypothetical protein CEUSTIGMA_g11949.t1, partial [Chlamydomonas eustigma]